MQGASSHWSYLPKSCIKNHHGWRIFITSAKTSGTDVCPTTLQGTQVPGDIVFLVLDDYPPGDLTCPTCGRENIIFLATFKGG